MHEAEEVTVRRVMTQAACVVNKEINRLYSDIHDRDGLIDSQQKQIRIMRESVEYANEEKHKSYRVADQSIVMMYWSWIVAFLAIGYAVLVG